MEIQKIDSILKNYGFTDKESAIYLALLKINSAPPSIISKKTGVKRSTVYVVLEQMKAKGLVTSVKKHSGINYSIRDPKKYLQEEKEKFDTLTAIIPDLLKLHEKYGITPQMSLFEGTKGLMQIMEDTLTASDELMCWADISLASNTILGEYYPSYIKKKVERGIWLRGIFCYDKTGLEFKKRSKKELREVYLIPKEKFPFKNEINIYDDKVAIISHQDLVGVIIQNQNIADTQKAIFNLGFEYAQILEKQILTKEDKAFLARKED